MTTDAIASLILPDSGEITALSVIELDQSASKNASRRMPSNVIAGVLNSIWTAAAALIAVPIYLRLFGLAGYGLITFFVTLQGLFIFLDFGMTATINREIARALSDGTIARVRNVLRTFTLIYWIVAAVIFSAVLALVPVIAESWLNVGTMSQSVVREVLVLMGATIAIRWPVGIYMSALLGAQQAVRANLVSLVATTLSTFGAIAILWLVSSSIQAYFIWQVVVAGLQVAVMRDLAWKAVPGGLRPRVDWVALRPLWAFAAGVAGSTVLGALTAQLDKFLVPEFVSLARVGAYGVATLLARPVLLLIVPFFSALYPYLAALIADRRETEAIATYRAMSALAAAIIFSWSALIWVDGSDILSVWTRNPALAREIGTVAPMLVLGSALCGISLFPHALQLAYGKAGIPMVINVFLVIFYLPALLVLIPRLGIIGAAAAWLAMNVLNMFVSLGLTHRTILPKLLWPWLTQDVCQPAVLAGGIVWLGHMIIGHLQEQEIRLIAMILLAGVGTGVSAAASGQIRGVVDRYLKRADPALVHGQANAG